MAVTRPNAKNFIRLRIGSPLLSLCKGTTVVPEAVVVRDRRNQLSGNPGTPPVSSQAPDTTKGSESPVSPRLPMPPASTSAEISSAASSGASQAGQHGAPSSTPPVSTPNIGGTGMANTASNGASSVGTGTADDASGGHSSAGS